jgi:hypothetical protein
VRTPQLPIRQKKLLPGIQKLDLATQVNSLCCSDISKDVIQNERPADFTENAAEYTRKTK